MTNSESNEWIYSANFEETFTKLIASDDFFDFVSNELTSDNHWPDYTTRFPNTQATPFRRELRRWITKAAPHRIKPRGKQKSQKSCCKANPVFHGTIKNLEIYCKLFQQTPNQVFGLATNGKNKTKLRFLTRADIETIYYLIKKNKNKFTHVEWPVLLPVEFNFKTFSMLYVKIYKGRSNSDVLTITFLACDFNRAHLANNQNTVIIDATATDEKNSSSNTFFSTDIANTYRDGKDRFDGLKLDLRCIPTFVPAGKTSFSAILEECLRTTKTRLAGDFFKTFSPKQPYRDTSKDETQDEDYGGEINNAVAKAKQEARKRNAVP